MQEEKEIPSREETLADSNVKYVFRSVSYLKLSYW